MSAVKNSEVQVGDSVTMTATAKTGEVILANEAKCKVRATDGSIEVFESKDLAEGALQKRSMLFG